MGLSNKVVFVEITDPENPDIVASIAHTNSLWGDIKVYGTCAYAVNESGGGVQVIDMSDIDNGVVTLVRTLTSPGTSHNIAVDPISGRLYTCGSRGGAATTVIYDLATPSNPQQIGVWSSAYQHDIQGFTFTSGPNAGKKVMFGSSTGNGMDVIDATNPANPVLLSRTAYPSVSYCHQMWTEDGRYVFIDDELDSIPRTTVFDVANLAAPVLLGSYSTGTGATDHNLYVDEGFVFQADYKSGLRIFDANENPANPTLTGFFDTYPGDDGSGFEGAWSCYPFFPSGTVIVSDINRGLFILNCDAARVPTDTINTGFEVVTGNLLEGDIIRCRYSDESAIKAQSGFGQTFVDLHKMEADVTARTGLANPVTIDLLVEAKINQTSGSSRLMLWNFDQDRWDSMGDAQIGATDATHAANGIAAAPYVGDEGEIRMRIRHLVFSPVFAFRFESDFDRIDVDAD